MSKSAQPSDAIIASTYAELGNQLLVAAALGIGKSTVSRAIARHRAAEVAAAASAQSMADVSIRDLERAFRELRENVAPEPTYTPVEKPRIRVQAGSSSRIGMVAPLWVPASPRALEVPVFDRGNRPQPKLQQPLGDDGPFIGEVFGVHGRQSSLILEKPSTERRRIMCINDTHWTPALEAMSLRIARIMGIHAARGEFDYLVHGGDGPDFHSMCGHERDNTYSARQKPSIRQDLNCFASHISLLSDVVRDLGCTIPCIYSKGNHCEWAERYENENPAVKDLITSQRDGALDENGWQHRRYGEIIFIAGVGFVHAPLNKMGKPPGGMNPENTIANQVTHDLVWWHTHWYAVARRLKFGLNQNVTVINGGSSMIPGYVGDFAHRSTGTSVSYGILEIETEGGRIVGHRHVDMVTLERLHGAEADRTFTAMGGR